MTLCVAVSHCPIWLGGDMVWLAPKAGENGRSPVFGNAAIKFCPMVKVLFGLPLRQTTGMVACILSMAGLDWPVPEDYRAATARNETLRATRRLGRTAWKRWSGYHARSRVEAKMRCLKAFGERIASRDRDRQTAETHIRVALVNRFNALGTAEIKRVA